MQAEVEYLNQVCGLELSPSEICRLLERMGYSVKPSDGDNKLLDVSVPVTRADVLHQCDVMEDLAVSHAILYSPFADITN
jgi:phenylalanyl-tRNA synthetase beta chain